MRISDWSSDVCSSDLPLGSGGKRVRMAECFPSARSWRTIWRMKSCFSAGGAGSPAAGAVLWLMCGVPGRSEEHTSELQSLMRISYAVFCLKKKTQQHTFTKTHATIASKIHSRIANHYIQ